MKTPKVYAVYLPQFYETEHNNKWWGEGFTDWTTVREAESLFPEHRQPIIPLNNNYYDLSDKKTMEWQAKLAKKYGVDGFSFYHYYFGDGKMELEKPAQNLLVWKDIDMPFYFCWANESWIRTWSKFTGNVWAEKYDSQKESNDGILVEQKYGDEKEWTAHFYYLLPFFQDKRYIRINNKPMFSITGPDNISCLKSMIQLWRELAIKEGLEGLYIVGLDSLDCESDIDAVQMSDTPMQYRREYPQNVKICGGVNCVDYKCFLDNYLEKGISNDIKTYFQCMCGYDTTPRRGSSGDCIVGRSPMIFQDFFVQLLKKSIYCQNEFVVINAWNEWGEGMYLEPDSIDKYGYLEAIYNAKKIVEEISAEEFAKKELYFMNAGNEDVRAGYKKFKSLCGIYSKWLQKEIDRETIFVDRINDKGIRSVAIYGMGDLGRNMVRCLKREGVNVEYGIDMYVARDRAGIIIYRPEDDLPEVDAIIITAYDRGEIKENLKEKMNCKLLYLSDFFD